MVPRMYPSMRLEGKMVLPVKNLRVLCLVSVLALSAGAIETSASQLGGRPAEKWIQLLESEERVSGLKIEEVVSRLSLKPGDIVADIGAGSGVFCGPLAQAVAPRGMVLAVEIDQDLLDYIDQRAQQENIKNIKTVLGQFNDPGLTTHEVDVAFLHNVLHHIEQREVYLKALVSYLKPEGRIAVIDLIKDHPDSPHKDQRRCKSLSRSWSDGWRRWDFT